MHYQNPIKSAGLCFYASGAQTEIFFPAAEMEAVASLARLLETSGAAILSLDNFSQTELLYLQSRRAADGRPIFAGADCVGQKRIGRGCRCGQVCALRGEAPATGTGEA
jgi:hypothetical protein